MPRTKKKRKISAKKKYADGTTYKDSKGKTHRRKSFPRGHPKQVAYCARSREQKQTEKVKVRRAAWNC